MRILFISNLFPPHARGGYEQWCEEVALALTARGHELCILTAQSRSDVSAADAAQPFPVHRLLHTEVQGGLGLTALHLLRGTAQREQANLRSADTLVRDFQPDASLIWGMWNISRRVPQRLESLLGDRLGYFFCDYWPTLPNAYVQRLQEPARRKSRQWVKSALAHWLLPRLADDGVTLRFPHPICVSAAVCELLTAHGVPIGDAQVIYGGTALAEAPAGMEEGVRQSPSDQELRLLYLGRLEPIKGVHTVVEAMSHLAGSVPITLDIVGSGGAEYEGYLQMLVQEYGLSSAVHLRGPVSRAEVPQVMAEHNALVFPSEWEEPFARSVLEAMAAGLAVVGSTTGGTGELLVEGQTGLTFAAGDSEGLARQLRRLAQDPALRCRLAASGLAVVRSRYTLRRMVDELEVALCAIAGQNVQSPVQA